MQFIIADEHRCQLPNQFTKQKEKLQTVTVSQTWVSEYIL